MMDNIHIVFRDVPQGKRTETVCIPRRIELRLEWNGLEDIHDQNEGKVLHLRPLQAV